jgi:hypothetical protein
MPNAAAASNGDDMNAAIELSKLRNLQVLYLNNNNLSGNKFLTAA